MIATVAATWDGASADALAAALDVPAVHLFATTESTMDEAHRLAAAGAPNGTFVLAEEQTRGRGRSGARWVGEAGGSILCTVIERPDDTESVGVVSLRVGIEVAAALDPFAGTAPVQVKWPNDVLVDGAKVAGILIETRWRDSRPEWMAVAIGLNVARPVSANAPNAGGLAPGVRRLDVLPRVVRALRTAAAARGPLSAAECAEWRRRDYLAGRAIRSPVAGVVEGIVPTGELLVRTSAGRTEVRAGSIELETA